MVLLFTLLFLFTVNVLLVIPWAIFKLGALLGVVFFALRAHRREEEDISLLVTVAGPVKFSYTLLLLIMPVAATSVYAIALYAQPAEESICLILELIPPLQGVVGGSLFMWALFMSLRTGFTRVDGEGFL